MILWLSLSVSVNRRLFWRMRSKLKEISAHTLQENLFIFSGNLRISCRGLREGYTENSREFWHSLTRLRSVIEFWACASRTVVILFSQSRPQSSKGMHLEVQVARFWLNACRVSESLLSCAAIRSEALATGKLLWRREIYYDVIDSCVTYHLKIWYQMILWGWHFAAKRQRSWHFER